MSLRRDIFFIIALALTPATGCKSPAQDSSPASRHTPHDATAHHRPNIAVPALAPPPPNAIPVGWDLIPIDDGNGGTDTTWLVLTARPSAPSPLRELINIGPRSRCTELAPHVLRPRAGSRGAPIRALITVRCELPERGDFSLAETSPRHWEILRSGCADGFYPCPPGATPDEIVARASIDTANLPAFAPGPIARRELPPTSLSSPDAGAAGVTTTTTPPPLVLSWQRGPRMNPLIPGTAASDNLSLVLHGPLDRRLDLGPMGDCTIPPRPLPRVSPRASLLRYTCIGAGRGTRVWSVTRDRDSLSIHLTITDSHGGVTEPMRVTQRIELPPGTPPSAPSSSPPSPP